MLNLGSARPPVETVPLGLLVCWRMPSAVVKSSMRVLSEELPTAVNWSMMALKTSEESRVQV